MAKGRARRYTDTAGRTYIRLPYDESKGWIDASTRHVTATVARQLGFDGSRSGRPIGRKNFSVRSKYHTKKELLRITEDIKKGIRASGSIASQLASPNIAGSILQNIHRESKFNIYTGNLSYSYQAVIVTGRKARQIVSIGKIDGVEPSNVDTTESGSRYATLQLQRHSIRAGKGPNLKRNRAKKGSGYSIQHVKTIDLVRGKFPINELLKRHRKERIDARKKRYLKNWEKAEGYAGNRIHTVNSKRQFGFYQLDKATNGLQKTDLIILAARPGVGKTSLAMNIVSNAAINHGAKCAVFSLEMGREQLAQRMLCSVANVSMAKALRGDLDEHASLFSHYRV
jgi:hypothetical protein